MIGAGTGWLIAWAVNRQLAEFLKYIIFGAIGGLAGGFLIDILIKSFIRVLNVRKTLEQPWTDVINIWVCLFTRLLYETKLYKPYKKHINK